MNNDYTPQKADLRFLQPNTIADETIPLLSGEQILIQKYFLNFNQWAGTPIVNRYGNKAVINWNGEPLFAELAVVRIFQSQGWDGVWVDSYRRKYRIGLPDVVSPIDLPVKYEELLTTIRTTTGRSGGCWDVLVWKDSKILFIELKRRKKDSIQDSQKQWLEYSLSHGLLPSNFALIEWELNNI